MVTPKQVVKLPECKDGRAPTVEVLLTSGFMGVCGHALNEAEQIFQLVW